MLIGKIKAKCLFLTKCKLIWTDQPIVVNSCGTYMILSEINLKMHPQVHLQNEAYVPQMFTAKFTDRKSKYLKEVLVGDYGDHLPHIESNFIKKVCIRHDILARSPETFGVSPCYKLCQAYTFRLVQFQACLEGIIWQIVQDSAG